MRRGRTGVLAAGLLAVLLGLGACAGGPAGAPAAGSDPSAGPSRGPEGVPESPAPAPAQGAAKRPGEILGLENWYLTLPTGDQGDPDTITQPKLAAYTSTYFHPNDAGNGIVFTATAGGATTKGSNYPRSELREMVGSAKASWSNTSGTHVLKVREAVTRLPPVKPDLVTAQIHDTVSDVIEIRLKGRQLVAEYGDGATDIVLDPNYELTTPFDVVITAANGRIAVSYNGVNKVDVPVQGTGWYFKSGCYLQSNPSRGERSEATGQVVIYALSASHTP